MSPDSTVLCLKSTSNIYCVHSETFRSFWWTATDSTNCRSFTIFVRTFKGILCPFFFFLMHETDSWNAFTFSRSLLHLCSPWVTSQTHIETHPSGHKTLKLTWKYHPFEIRQMMVVYLCKALLVLMLKQLKLTFLVYDFQTENLGPRHSFQFFLDISTFLSLIEVVCF